MALLAPASASAQNEDPAAGAGPDAPWRAYAQWDEVDEEATADIHRFTTEPRYITPMVSFIPQDARVPSPRDVLGHIAGAEGLLTRFEDTVRYFEELAKASPRVTLLEMGRTEEDRPMHLVIVTSEENMGQLDRFKAFTAALADSRETDEAEARRIIEQAKPIVHMTAGLHSPETGPPEMVMELAYRLAVSDHPDVVKIRDDVITMITPVTEPEPFWSTLDSIMTMICRVRFFATYAYRNPTFISGRGRAATPSRRRVSWSPTSGFAWIALLIGPSLWET